MNTIKLDPHLHLTLTQVSDGSIINFPQSKTKATIILNSILAKSNLDRATIIEMNQVHGSHVIVIDKKLVNAMSGQKIPNTDGMITNLKHTPLMIKTADCIPLVLYDPNNHAVGVCHVGWRGAMQKIHLVALLKMTNLYKSKLQSIKVWLGPAIQSCCYTLTKPPNQRHLPEWQPYITSKKDLWHVDYVQFVIDSLIDAGVKKSNIINSGQCTYHQKQWYSYARAQQTGETDGRFATFVTLQ